MSRRRRRFRLGRGLGAVLAFAVGALFIAAAGGQVPTPRSDAAAQSAVESVVGFLVVAWGIFVLLTWVSGRPRRRRRARSRTRRR